MSKPKAMIQEDSHDLPANVCQDNPTGSAGWGSLAHRVKGTIQERFTGLDRRNSLQTRGRPDTGLESICIYQSSRGRISQL